MTEGELTKIVEERLDKIRSTLLHKAKEYAIGDMLANFKRGSNQRNRTPAQYCLDLMSKQLLGVSDIADGNLCVSYLDEKLGDCVCYLVLLEAIFKEAESHHA